MRQELIQLDRVDLNLLRLLAGSHSLGDLVADSERLAAIGSLTVYNQRSEALLRSSLEQRVQDSLERIAPRALLVKQDRWIT